MWHQEILSIGGLPYGNPCLEGGLYSYEAKWHRVVEDAWKEVPN